MGTGFGNTRDENSSGTGWSGSISEEIAPPIIGGREVLVAVAAAEKSFKDNSPQAIADRYLGFVMGGRAEDRPNCLYAEKKCEHLLEILNKNTKETEYKCGTNHYCQYAEETR